jgi:hypothetical protein
MRKYGMWQPLCHCQNLYVTPVCDKITLLWITEIWPFWLNDHNRQDNKMMGLWGCTADAQPKKKARHENFKFGLKLDTMAVRVVESSNGGYKIRKVFA